MEQKKDEEIKIPDVLPVLPLRDVVIFPHMIVPLYVGRDFSIRAIDEALSKDRLLMLVAQKRPEDNEPGVENIYTVGSVSLILRMIKLPDGRVKILVQGLSKAKITEYKRERPFMEAAIEVIKEEGVKSHEEELEIEALVKNIRTQLDRLASLDKNVSTDLVMVVSNIDEPSKFADVVASNIHLRTKVAQEILETVSLRDRLFKLSAFLDKEIQLLEVRDKIQDAARGEISKTQREYFLREQLKAIKKELGEEVEGVDEIEELKGKIAEAKMPKLARKEAEKQLSRLSKMHPDSAEATVVRTYLDWMVSVPWSKSTKDYLNIKRVARVLDEDHYDLREAKDRILEYLSVRKLKKEIKGPILCFVGPPGVGKTSLAKSIARAMGRKLCRISLGGVRDEAEIRGHRRTYVGALPGRIIQGLKQAGTNNPVFVLDEVDKLGVDFRGDPASALLEVLDPEQNCEFEDHYLGVPFDLSKVFFITTANTTDTIPSPLLDRMEVIKIPGYTVDEKIKIAQRYILPKEIKNNGLEKYNIIFTDNSIKKIIEDYTREAGVRNMEKAIASVLRKIARRIAEKATEDKTFRVTTRNIGKYLGAPKYFTEEKLNKCYTGVATGLAWTPVGGSILFIEVVKVKGSGKLMLTGSLGEVMKESAQAAVTYAREHYKDLGLKEDFYQKIDLHIHIPEGATPKDGPSGGVAIASAIISSLTDKPVRNDVAMTGELTLTGRILPVGGIKEKTLAALRAGIKEVVVPLLNKKDVEEISKDIIEKVKFHYVEDMSQVIDLVLVR
ncbi:MAG: endopeptidase La [Deltaproteobacteria bacterium]|nr:endopeptidase La [Deltaproteobacteria bacterium]